MRTDRVGGVEVDRSEPVEDLTEVRHVIVYGDFNCPWSYLASRRAALLSTNGLQVDWRAVEHAPLEDLTAVDPSDRFENLRSEMEDVEALLLPGELLPFALAGFLPHTHAAITAYAEAYATGASARVRAILFEALWLHSLDLADPSVVHTLVVDAIQSQRPAGHPMAHWEYDSEPSTNSSRTTAARLAGTWAMEWSAISHGTVPTVLVNGVDPILGVAAVDWLGRQLANWRLIPESARQ